LGLPVPAHYRKALKEAIEIIERLDDLVLSLYEELNKKD